MATTCDVPAEIVQDFKKFKLSKQSGVAIIFKVNKEKLLVEIDQQMDNVSISDVAAALPESAPRFIAYSYKYTHPDGRTSLPLVFIFYCPRDISPTLNMLYTSTKTRLINSLEIMKTFDVQDVESLNQDWLNEKMKFFK